MSKTDVINEWRKQVAKLINSLCPKRELTTIVTEPPPRPRDDVTATRVREHTHVSRVRTSVTRVNMRATIGGGCKRLKKKKTRESR